MAEAGTVTSGVIRWERAGAIGRIVLGIGSIPATEQDWQSWSAALDQWAADPNVYGALVRSSRSGPLRDFAGVESLDQLADLYRLIWTIDRFSKPNVALLNGEMTWADYSLVRHGTHKVVGEHFRMSLATAGGRLPDAGASWWLARLPGELGIELVRSGAVLDGADALALGLATHRISASRFDAIEAAFADAEPIDQVLDGLPMLEGGGTLAAQREEAPSARESPSRRDLDVLIAKSTTPSLRETLERDFAIALVGGEGQAWTTWSASLDRAAAKLNLRPPAGVPEALG